MVRRVKRPSFLSSTCAAALAATTVLAACGDDTQTDEPATDAGSSASRRFTGQQRPAASCPVVLEAPSLLDSPHIPESAPVTYNSNPPSSGPHFSSWAHFQEYDKPIAPGFLVHSMEHGAVVLLYKCDGPTAPGCAPLVEGLRKVRDAAKTDPRCDAATRVRIVIAPDPKLETPIAAAAWGFTYKADCVDAPTLSKFIADNYALAPEDFCSPGRTAF